MVHVLFSVSKTNPINMGQINLNGDTKYSEKSNRIIQNEKKAISNAYLIPPAHYWSIKKMRSEYKGHKNMQKAGFLMNRLI